MPHQRGIATTDAYRLVSNVVMDKSGDAETEGYSVSAISWFLLWLLNVVATSSWPEHPGSFLYNRDLAPSTRLPELVGVVD